MVAVDVCKALESMSQTFTCCNNGAKDRARR